MKFKIDGVIKDVVETNIFCGNGHYQYNILNEKGQPVGGHSLPRHLVQKGAKLYISGHWYEFLEV